VIQSIYPGNSPCDIEASSSRCDLFFYSQSETRDDQKKRHSPQQQRQHIQARQTSGLTEQAYARRAGLNIKSFGNWTRCQAPADSVFIPAQLTPAESAPVPNGLTLNLPAGCVISGSPAPRSERWSQSTK